MPVSGTVYFPDERVQVLVGLGADPSHGTQRQRESGRAQLLPRPHRRAARQQHRTAGQFIESLNIRLPYVTMYLYSSQNTHII